ncbi:MAG: cytochrome c biogenesis protein ResB [Phycisphaerae bacterium]
MPPRPAGTTSANPQHPDDDTVEPAPAPEASVAVADGPRSPAPTHSSPTPHGGGPSRRPGRPVARWRRILAPLASLRLTCGLFVLSMALIFAGTLAQAQQGVWRVMDGYFRSLIAWVDVQLFIPQQLWQTDAAVPFPGGFLLGGLLILNLIAAHAVRFKLSAKRPGMITLHAGLILLLASEFVTGLMADEGQMTIAEGQTAGYVEDIRSAELAVIDRSDPAHDLVVKVPQAMLEAAAETGRTISHPDLPFDVRVTAWLRNSQLFRASPDPSFPAPRATAGLGRQVVAVETPEAAGVSGGVDAPSAVIELSRDGQVLGRWLVSLNMATPQPVVTGDDTRDVVLRFRRTYKPYEVHLIDFRHDKFVGTEKPRNFSSEVVVTDRASGQTREALISMNNPLRYAGDALYQSAFLEQDRGTILQVVSNPGWLLPYIACGLVTLGLVAHFGISLTTFLRRQRP